MCTPLNDFEGIDPSITLTINVTFAEPRATLGKRKRSDGPLSGTSSKTEPQKRSKTGGGRSRAHQSSPSPAPGAAPSRSTFGPVAIDKTTRTVMLPEQSQQIFYLLFDLLHNIYPSPVSFSGSSPHSVNPGAFVMPEQTTPRLKDDPAPAPSNQPASADPAALMLDGTADIPNHWACIVQECKMTLAFVGQRDLNKIVAKHMLDVHRKKRADPGVEQDLFMYCPCDKPDGTPCSFPLTPGHSKYGTTAFQQHFGTHTGSTCATCGKCNKKHSRSDGTNRHAKKSHARDHSTVR